MEVGESLLLDNVKFCITSSETGLFCEHDRERILGKIVGQLG